MIVVSEGEVGGFTLRRLPYDSDTTHVHEGHLHYIPHVTFIESGSVRCQARFLDGTTEEVIAKAGQFIYIAAKTFHTFWPLEKGTRRICQFAEAEAIKWLDQDHIKAAIAALERHAEDTAGLRSMLLDDSERPDDILETVRLRRYSRTSRDNKA